MFKCNFYQKWSQTECLEQLPPSWSCCGFSSLHWCSRFQHLTNSPFFTKKYSEIQSCRHQKERKNWKLTLTCEKDLFLGMSISESLPSTSCSSSDCSPVFESSKSYSPLSLLAWNKVHLILQKENKTNWHLVPKCWEKYFLTHLFHFTQNVIFALIVFDICITFRTEHAAHLSNNWYNSTQFNTGKKKDHADQNPPGWNFRSCFVHHHCWFRLAHQCCSMFRETDLLSHPWKKRFSQTNCITFLLPLVMSTSNHKVKLTTMNPAMLSVSSDDESLMDEDFCEFVSAILLWTNLKTKDRAV